MANPYSSAFTYNTWPSAPDNAATDYVDPTKYTGIVDRFDAIAVNRGTGVKLSTSEGGTAPNTIIAKVAKFNETYFVPQFEAAGVLASRKNYAETPLISLGMTLHNFTVSSISKLAPLTLVTNSPNGVYTGQKFKFTSVSSSSANIVSNMNNQEFYVRKLSNTSVELYYDEALQQPVDAYVWINGALSAPVLTTASGTVFNVDTIVNGSNQPYFTLSTSTAHYMHTGQALTITSSAHYTWMNGNTYYIKKINDYVVQLFVDSGLTNPLNVTTLTASTYDMTGITGSASTTIALTARDIPADYAIGSNGTAILRIETATPHGLVAGVHDLSPAVPITFTARTSTYVDENGSLKSGVDSSWIDFIAGKVYYPKVISTTKIDLYLDPALTTPRYLSEITFKNVGGAIFISGAPRFYSYIYSNSPVTLKLNPVETAVDDLEVGSNIEVKFSTNTLGISTTQTYYGKKIVDPATPGSTSYTCVEVYTNPGLTVPLTCDQITSDQYQYRVDATTGLHSLDAIDGSPIMQFTGFTMNKNIQNAQVSTYSSSSGGIRYLKVSKNDYPSGSNPFYTAAGTAVKGAIMAGITQMSPTTGAYTFIRGLMASDGSPNYDRNCFYRVQSEDTNFWYVGFYKDAACTVVLDWDAPSAVGFSGAQYYVTFQIQVKATVNKIFTTSAGLKARVTVQGGHYVGYNTTTVDKQMNYAYKAILPQGAWITSGSSLGFNYTNSNLRVLLNNQLLGARIKDFPADTTVVITHNDTAQNYSEYTVTFHTAGSTGHQALTTTAVTLPDRMGVAFGLKKFNVSEQSHRLLSRIAITDPNFDLKTGSAGYYVMPAKYFRELDKTILGTNVVFTVVGTYTRGGENITLIDPGVGLPRTPGGGFQTSWPRLGDGSTSTKTITWTFDKKIYANACYPMCSDSEWPLRSGLQVTVTSNYLGNTKLPAGTYWADVQYKDQIFGRTQTGFRTIVSGENFVDATAAYAEYAIDAFNYSASGTQTLVSYEAPNLVTLTSTYNMRDGTPIDINSTGNTTLDVGTHYVKFVSRTDTTVNYQLYSNQTLTTPISITLTIPTLTSTVPVSQNEVYPWKASTITLWYGGTKKFIRYNEALNSGAGGYEAYRPTQLNYVARAGVTNFVGDYPTITFTQNTTGEITAVSLSTSDPGKFTSSAEVVPLLGMPSNIGTPTPVYDPENGVFDTHDSWAQAGYTQGHEKYWPTHVQPRSAVFRTEQPTRVTTSQSMVRYARSTGNIRYAIDLEYPPMTLEQYAPFRAVIEACQGQWNQIELPISILLDNPMGTRHQLIAEVNTYEPDPLNPKMAAGASVLYFEGLEANDPQAIEQGQFIRIYNTNALPNGAICMALHNAASNSYGETAVRITHPIKAALEDYVGGTLRPSSVVVSLNSDTHEVNIDTAMYYTMKISFILTGWA